VDVLYLVLMAVACFCFFCTALGVRARIDLLGAGLFCWALVSSSRCSTHSSKSHPLGWVCKPNICACG